MSWSSYGGQNRGSAEPPRVTVFERFRTSKLVARGEIRDEVVEMVGRSGLFDANDLILRVEGRIQDVVEERQKRVHATSVV
jgi:hypothetical protein